MKLKIEAQGENTRKKARKNLQGKLQKTYFNKALRAEKDEVIRQVLLELLNVKEV